MNLLGVPPLAWALLLLCGAFVLVRVHRELRRRAAERVLDRLYGERCVVCGRREPDDSGPVLRRFRARMFSPGFDAEALHPRCAVFRVLR